MARVEQTIIAKEFVKGIRSIREAEKIVARVVDPSIELQRRVENGGVSYIGMKKLVRKKAA